MNPIDHDSLIQVQLKTMNEHHYVVIMAGGIGSRFWPMSRQDFPKQFLDILNYGKSLIQGTFERFASFIPILVYADDCAYRRARPASFDSQQLAYMP